MNTPFVKTCLVVFVSLVVSGCSNQNKVSKTDASPAENVLSISTRVSNYTKLFISDYQKELENSNQSEIDFKPSANLIDKYSLSLIDNKTYFIKGLATLHKDFDKAQLSSLGIKTGSELAGKTSLLIPIYHLNQFLHLDKIEYFEIAEKAQLKN